MNTRYASTAVVSALLLCTACGGKAHDSTAAAGAGNVPDGSAPDAHGGACGSVPVPKDHRAVAEACPAARGSLGPLNLTTCADRSGIKCTGDADCTAGKNGRCYLNSDPCQTVCSYDECVTDSDCAAGPCACRGSGTDVVANACLPGSTCRTDADCGNCNYCSPSIVPNPTYCASELLTYACHTANDECTDQSDCPADEPCGADTAKGPWKCGFCVQPPHP